MKAASVIHKESTRFAHLHDHKPGGEDFFFHSHNDYEFLYFIGGNADFVIENKIYSLNKNDLLVILPTQRHKLCILSSTPYERCVFNFKKNNLRRRRNRVSRNRRTRLPYSKNFHHQKPFRWADEHEFRLFERRLRKIQKNVAASDDYGYEIPAEIKRIFCGTLVHRKNDRIHQRSYRRTGFRRNARR